MEKMIMDLAIGALSGLAYAGTGYFKNRAKESISIDKAIMTMAKAAVIGGLAGYMGMPAESIASMPFTMGLLAAFDNLWKGLKK
jgi:hypothetical protein